MKYLALGLLLAGLLPPALATAPPDDDMKPYPAPGEGVTRAVIRLPALESEDLHKIEVLVGKTLLVDCNPTWFGGELETRVAQGWGYSYYVLERVGPAASTLMACPPDEEKKEAFVPVRGDGFLLRYNSKLPVVVYVPEGFEVRYRIWAAGEETGHAEVR